MDVFGSAYSGYYDALYSDLDYELSYAALCWGLAYAKRRVCSVLDVGCGTGEFTKRLLADGHQVVGVDLSEHMLGQAAVKCPQADLRWSSATAYNFASQFDAIIMMGGVLGYQDDNDTVLKALRLARHHLAPGGALVVDVWNANAVLAEGVGERAKVIKTQDGEVIRIARGSLKYDQSVCTVDYQLWRADGDQLVTVEERHRMRYFMPAELSFFLMSAGFSVQKVCPFPTVLKALGTDHWHMMAVAVAI